MTNIAMVCHGIDGPLIHKLLVYLLEMVDLSMAMLVITRWFLSMIFPGYVLNNQMVLR